jgi:hypothetical protein
MKKYYVYYWSYRNDQWEDYETEIKAINFEDAYEKFKKEHKKSKIQKLELIN